MVFGLGVSCLQLYVQNNWVGPATAEDPRNLLPPCCQPQLQVLGDVLLHSFQLSNSTQLLFN